MKTTEEKFRDVLEKNTFYFFNAPFQEEYEGYLNSLKQTLLVLRNDIENQGLKKEVFEKLLIEKENGLRALLALTGLSNEYLKRLTTIIRVVDNSELSNLVYKENWKVNEDLTNIQEWSDTKIKRMIKTNEYFRKGLINLFFEGATVPFLANTIPLFELKKLSISKLQFEIPEMIDTLTRYKEKGSYSGKKERNAESVIASILEEVPVQWEIGNLEKLPPDIKRTMDFIIPNRSNPKVIIESSYLNTTSSGQGDKAKTEIQVSEQIKKFYPTSKFIGFIDGLGWYVRKGDLKRMVMAFEDVFTFQKDELKRFEKFIIEEMAK